jgi:hypothetical protein
MRFHFHNNLVGLRLHHARSWRRSAGLNLVFRCFTLLLWLVTGEIVLAQSSNVPLGAIGFDTGAGQTLQRSNVLFGVPANLPAVSVSFDAGFATDEIVVSGQFYDSFSATLRNTNKTFTAALFTADVFGFTWAPSDPSGLSLTNTLLFEPIPFPPLGHPFPAKFAYRAAVEIPQFMLGQTNLLLISLVDNGDTSASVGFIQNVRLSPSLNSPLALESSSSVGDSFAEESSIRINRVLQTITLPGAGMVRFFRLRGNGPSHITAIRLDGSDVVLDYEASPGDLPVLESSAQVHGPYAAEFAAQGGAGANQLRLPVNGMTRYFRLRSDTPLVIRQLERSGGDLIFHYDLP